MPSNQLAIPVADPPRRQVLTERCAKCGALEGEPFKTSDGRYVSYEHAVRRRLTIFVPIGGK